MKFLELPAFAQLTNHYLDGAENMTADSKIYGRIEAFSCKRAGSDKKLYKSLEQQYQVELSKSPETELFSSSPFGPLTESSSRKTLISLISLLNASFPDYDFGNLKPEQFRKESSLYMVINSINTTLASALANYNTEIAPKLWAVIDTEANLKECDIYSYIPDFDSDPYAEENAVWSFNYFFYNKYPYLCCIDDSLSIYRKLKRIIFFSCHAVKKFSKSMSEPEMLGGEGIRGWMDDEMDL